MATANCQNCGWPAEQAAEQRRQQLEETLLLNQGKPPKAHMRFLQRLKKVRLEIDLGGGSKEELVFDEANERYVSLHFPNLDNNAYCLPPFYEYEYPEEPSDLILNANNNAHASSVNRDYDTLRRKRKGQIAEEVVVNRFGTMLRKYKIPSFIIHGYAWKAKFIKNLTKLDKDFQKLSLKEGEIDLFISIPGKCILVMEVKAVSDVSNITSVVNKAFTQSGKTFEFLSMVVSDLREEGQIPVIKTVVIPNCQRTSVRGKFCQPCSNHIVTLDDLENVKALHDWFTRLLTNCSRDSQFDINLQKHLIGRLIGPASLMEVKSIPESIQRTVSQLDSVESEQIVRRWCQLNPSQLSVSLREQNFLWITGEPGSGKTLLGLCKTEDIVNDCPSNKDMANVGVQDEKKMKEGQEELSKACVLYVINGFSPVFAPSCLLEIYRERVRNASGNCEVFIMESHEMEKLGIDRQLFYKGQKLPHLIDRLQRKHTDKIIHVIIEECQMVLKQLDDKKFEKEWKDLVDNKRLGNVWIIQSSFITGTDSGASLPGFQKVHLDRIMRMSKQNVEFVNIFLDKQYKIGHGVTGNRPIIYRMKCICKEPSDYPTYQCFVCHVIRIVWMLHAAMNQLCVLGNELSTNERYLRNAVLISLQEQNISTLLLTVFNPFIPFSVNEYPKEEDNYLIVSSVRHFTGCEHSMVFVDLNSAFFDKCYEIECLTRTLGQMVMLDGGCFNEKVENYEQKIKKLQEADETGAAEIREIEPSTEDMKALKKILIAYLGHEKERLQAKVDVAKSDGFADRVIKAEERIKELEEQQKVAKHWLIENE